MNTTNVDSFAVVSIACFRSFHVSLRRASAMISAPVAPIAPPSVGVATPRKIVPSTRKISASGGISTNTTRSAIFDSSPNLKTRFRTAAKKATAVPTLVAITKTSSSGDPCIRSFAYATAENRCDDTSTSSDGFRPSHPARASSALRAAARAPIPA